MPLLTCSFELIDRKEMCDLKTQPDSVPCEFFFLFCTQANALHQTLEMHNIPSHVKFSEMGYDLRTLKSTFDESFSSSVVLFPICAKPNMSILIVPHGFSMRAPNEDSYGEL